MSELPHPFADRLALERWMERKLMRASPRVQRFIRAMADMPIEGRVKFLSVALLYSGDLSKILKEVAAGEATDTNENPLAELDDYVANSSGVITP